MAHAAASISDLPFNILTDLPSPQEWLDRLDVACHEMPALDEVIQLIKLGHVPTPMGELMKLSEDSVTMEQAALLFYLATTLKPILTIETGFKMGLTASVFTLAHMRNELSGGHVPIQEQAKLVNEGIGLYTLERLNLQGYQIMEHAPAVVLPQVYMQNLNKGLKIVYLNSAENADEQIMEYFYLNRMLNEGGVMAINLNHPARQQLVEFIRNDRSDYAIRMLPCNIALVQKPNVTELSRHMATRH
jgi:hypothetical protein